MNSYKKARSERDQYVENILKSKANKKIVVAGPGTGKTYLFKKALENKGNSIALTFINALVEDLSLELCGLSDVKTLHGYAYSVLRSKDAEINIFPKLTEVIEKDASILMGESVNYKKIFNNLLEESKQIDFYRGRKEYYGKYYGYSDVVYAVVQYFEKDSDNIPRYDQIVVDEYQDFNPLEVRLIDQLATKNPVLIVGDDDQAIYEFKDADPKHIRLKHSDKEPDYMPFDLPFCSRCTQVIVEAVNDIVDSANKAGLLKERVCKRYEYFPDEIKDIECTDNPAIIYSQQYAKRIPWFIGKQIIEIAQNIKNKFSVLVICPTRKQCSQVAGALKGKGFNNIEYVEKQDSKGVTLIDGLKLLLKNDKSNLGWRIVAEHLMRGNEFKTFLDKTYTNESKAAFEILGNGCKKEIDEMIKMLKKILKGKPIDSKSLDKLIRIGYDPYGITAEMLKDELIDKHTNIRNPGTRRVPIKISTVEGSKGLSADYVFIAFFDDQYFIKDKSKINIVDKDVCNFIVALTRARKKIYLISSRNNMPTFAKWIKKEKVTFVTS